MLTCSRASAKRESTLMMAAECSRYACIRGARNTPCGQRRIAVAVAIAEPTPNRRAW